MFDLVGWFEGLVGRWLGPATAPTAGNPTPEPQEESRPPGGPAVHVRAGRVALGVGVNEYAGSPENSLRGCANDSRNVKRDLEALGWRYPHPLLLDRMATRRKALEHIGNVAADLRRGEIATMQWSSHGTLTFDALEPDSAVEAICPHDSMADWPRNLITWRDLAAVFNGMADGALVVWLGDNCHAAPRPADANLLMRELMGLPENYRRPKTFTPPEGVIVPTRMERRVMLGPGTISTAWTRVVMWSGCASEETSADTYEDGENCGAMTASWRRAIKGRAGKPLSDQHASSLPDLVARKYDQHPQLVGAPGIVSRVIYGGPQ